MENKRVEMMQESIDIRGRILEKASITEMLAACVIAKYFTESKEAENELLLHVLATKNFSFDTKRDLLSTVLKKPRYNNFEHLDELHSILKDLITKRNILAHQVIDLSQESIDSYTEMDTFTYMRFKSKIAIAKFTKGEIVELENNVNKANEYLSELYEDY